MTISMTKVDMLKKLSRRITLASLSVPEQHRHRLCVLMQGELLDALRIACEHGELGELRRPSLA